MTSLRIVDLELAHLEALGAGDHAEHMEYPGRSFTMLMDDKPIAVGGIYVVREAVGIAWTAFSNDLRESALIMRRIHWAAKNLFVQAREQLKLERVEAMTLRSDRKACAWPKRFGFKFNGRMPKYYQGQEYILWGWTN